MNTDATPQSLLKQISQIQRMEPGKLCVMGQGPNGPYYNLQCREQGKTLSRYVPGDQSAAVAEHTNGRQDAAAEDSPDGEDEPSFDED